MPDQVRHDFSEGMDAGSPREIDVLISQGCNIRIITRGGMTIVT